MSSKRGERIAHLLESIDRTAEVYCALDPVQRDRSTEKIKLWNLFFKWEEEANGGNWDRPFSIVPGKETNHDGFQDAVFEILKSPPDLAECKFTTAFINKANFRFLTLRKKESVRERIEGESLFAKRADDEDDRDASEEDANIYREEIETGNFVEDEITDMLARREILNIADLIYNMKRTGRLVPTYSSLFSMHIINYSREQKELFDEREFSRASRSLDSGFCAKMTTSENGIFSSNLELVRAELSKYVYENRLYGEIQGYRDKLLDKSVADYEGISKSVLSKRNSSFRELVRQSGII